MTTKVVGLVTVANQFYKAGLDWFAAEASGLVGQSKLKSATAQAQKHSETHKRLATVSLVNLVEPEPVWKQSLSAIAQLVSGEPGKATPVATSESERLIWELDPKYDHISLDAYHQKRSGSGWSKGRKVADKRLYENFNDPEFAFLTDQDRELCRAIECEVNRNHYGYPEEYYFYNDMRAARALIGHPCIFRPGERDHPLEIVEQQPRLVVAQEKDGRISLSLDPKPHRDVMDLHSDLRLIQDGPQRVAIVFFDERHLKLRADTHWKDWVQRMRTAADVRPTVPTTLQAELREYQLEGFHWLARLAAWGAGGCLADDMGLGKTIQALALLLHRATGGPALVVAPTSVAFNWLSEAQRFAPTLNVRLFGEGDREAFFHSLGPRDVVVCSYGLLHNEAKRLQGPAWHTVVLDEAQAIKNMATQRSQAAMGLQADFRLIMTGTPLENHLGELWNLLEFINPGLLGSWDSFQQRFATPIERDGCRESRRRLKKLIQPFILRRTKSQVLQELPPRTELTLQVELSDEEAAFYEALRHRAIENLAKDADGPQHLRILAEIMRLRRACCHPRLVLEDCGIVGSKLALFLETLDELLDNHHKVLVFSQFVDHLSILRDELDRKDISYQYPDGSTPARQRKQCVEAFQAGEGDVFLISLKAGGLGLNLTAADYVIHMDPWWNPAVEDQASDRAHRLGQQRPVTIYRFITQGTIEQRITELHATKRHLADSLLEGTEMSGKLSAEELLKLIRE